jgi:proton glutamate symport protein
MKEPKTEKSSYSPSFRLTHWIFLSILLGLGLGHFFPDVAIQLKPLRSLFLNGIKLIIFPLIFSTLITGIAGTKSMRQLGRVGLRSILYFELVTTAALFLGLVFARLFRPGEGMHLRFDQSNQATPSDLGTAASFGEIVEHLLPSNLAESILHGDVLQMVTVASLFGISVLMAKEKEVTFRFTSLIMLLAPFGVGAAMAVSVAEHGLKILIPMLKLVGTFYASVLTFLVLILVPILKLAGVRIQTFFSEIKQASVLAFATTSSESAYPLAFQALERLGVPRRISSLVLPLGYSFNLDGSTLYLSLAALFIAQACDIELSLSTQLAMMLSLMLTSKGVAAVPRATLVVLSGTAAAFGLPLECIAILLAVDEFLDMGRTSLNLVGNCLATVVMARLEGYRIPNQEPLDDPTEETS